MGKFQKDESIFGYVQCDLVVPDELKSKFAIFPPIFKITEVGRIDIGDYMKNYSIENEMLKHPQKVLISSVKIRLDSLNCFSKISNRVIES